MASRLSSLVAGTCAVLALAGFGWGFAQKQKLAALAFSERRLTLVEAENVRLRGVLASEAQARAQADNLARRGAIEKEVAELRGLNFSQPVRYAVLTRAGIQSTLEKKLSAQMSDEDFRKAGIGLAALGLLPRDYPLKQKYLELLGEQVAAFYDQHQHQLFMFEDAALANTQNQIVLAHELTHALQDQHFGLLQLPLEIKDNDDRAFAASALIEGDATLVMSQYMLGHITRGGLRDTLAGALTQNMQQLQKAPRYLREMLVFPYLRGQEFCATLFAQDGWPALDAAYHHPPSSTAQILHPEKYLAEPREEPLAIDFGDPAVDGEKPVSDNVLGEMGLRILLSLWIDPQRAEKAAAGWRGDRYLVFENGDAWVWKSRWATAADAQEFCAALQAAMPRRFAQPPIPHFAATVLPSGNEVVFICAAADKWWESLRKEFAR